MDAGGISEEEFEKLKKGWLQDLENGCRGVSVAMASLLLCLITCVDRRDLAYLGLEENLKGCSEGIPVCSDP